MASATPPERLDSWKAIADYLRRDVATVRRWEKTQGLPVRRIPGGSGRGKSVFAYAAEIDAWLTTAQPAPAAEATAAPNGRRRLLAAAVFVVVLIASVGAWLAIRTQPPTADGLRVELNASGVTASDAAGAVRWRHAFPTDYRTFLSSMPVVLPGDPPEVLAQTSFRVHVPDDAPEGGTLMSFDLKGQLQRSFQFSDHLNYRGAAYDPPWVMTTFAVEGNGRDRRVAVAAHHFIWDPSLVALLNDRGERVSTFVHPGWIEALKWLAPNRLLLGGFSNPKDGGALVLLDPSAMNGQAPDATSTRVACESCGPDRPLRMVVMPRSEVNRASNSRFNHALIQAGADRLFVQTVEVWGDAPGEGMYEFNASLDLIGASFNDRYWEAHRALELERKLDHTREKCPDRHGPRAIEVWTLERGWTTQKIR